MDRRINVYTPAGYEHAGKTRYPVLYLLHGMGGDEDGKVGFKKNKHELLGFPAEEKNVNSKMKQKTGW